jgi:hypothetical protein
MKFDSLFERVVASTISGIIVSVVVMLVIERTLKANEEVASVSSIGKPMVWHESVPRW